MWQILHHIGVDIQDLAQHGSVRTPVRVAEIEEIDALTLRVEKGQVDEARRCAELRTGNRHRRPEENNRKSSLKRDAVKAWLTRYSDEMGQLQPNKQETHLQEGLTLEELWDEYLKYQADDDASKKISLSHWYKCVGQDFSGWLKIPKSKRFSQCDICASIKLLKEGLSKSQKGNEKLFLSAIV